MLVHFQIYAYPDSIFNPSFSCFCRKKYRDKNRSPICFRLFSSLSTVDMLHLIMFKVKRIPQLVLHRRNVHGSSSLVARSVPVHAGDRYTSSTTATLVRRRASNASAVARQLPTPPKPCPIWGRMLCKKMCLLWFMKACTWICVLLCTKLQVILIFLKSQNISNLTKFI
jgi:hypothetical protein